MWITITKKVFGGNLSVEHLLDHRVSWMAPIPSLETLDIRLGLCPIPVPQSIYCLSWTCVTYSFRDGSDSLLFSNSVSSVRSLFSPNLRPKEFLPLCCNSCHFVFSTFKLFPDFVLAYVTPAKTVSPIL